VLPCEKPTAEIFDSCEANHSLQAATLRMRSACRLDVRREAQFWRAAIATAKLALQGSSRQCGYTRVRVALQGPSSQDTVKHRRSHASFTFRRHRMGVHCTTCMAHTSSLLVGLHMFKRLDRLGSPRIHNKV
jgi:hypothetical protein